MGTEIESIADAILRELDKSKSGVIDLNEVPEFSKYKQNLDG